MTLHIMISGREHYTAPFHAEDLATTARAIREQLPALRQQGRVVVFVIHGNVSHLIVTA